jgi:hypothetical protein
VSSSLGHKDTFHLGKIRDILPSRWNLVIVKGRATMLHAKYVLISSFFVLAISASCFGDTIDRQAQRNFDLSTWMPLSADQAGLTNRAFPDQNNLLDSPVLNRAESASGKILLAQAKLPSLSEVNLLAPDQGGQALIVPNDNWSKLISGNEKDYVRVSVSQEAVYGFKDEKPAAFSKFSVLITGASDTNPKQIELLAADDSPTGEFRSVGVLSIVNAKVVKSPYQEVSFGEVKAKYVKIKILASYNCCGIADIGQIRLLGRPLQ